MTKQIKQIKQVIVMRTDLNMRKGKMVAQGAHAAVQSYNMVTGWDDKTVCEWNSTGHTKVCLQIDSEAALLSLWQAVQDASLAGFLVLDEGRTEFNNVPTYTCLAVGPANAEEIDKITGKLKLL